jgi:hypothetical protein
LTVSSPDGYDDSVCAKTHHLNVLNVVRLPL